MRLDERESQNVEDRRGMSPISGLGAGGIGLGTIVVAFVASYFLGIDPSVVLNLLSNTSAPVVQSAPANAPPPEDAAGKFVAKVLADTEDTWQTIFREAGGQYRDPKLVLFSGSTPTACGTGAAAMGPFYCAQDQRVYIDLSFYRDLRERFHAPGEFAEAYVIAHEVGHHVQNLLGISAKVRTAQEQASSKAEVNGLSVRVELQADCFAGVWANRADAMRNIIEPGEVDQALTAASAIGDDRLQQRRQGFAVPETFTHGTSEQRVRWFKKGMETGDAKQCDTFKKGGL